MSASVTALVVAVVGVLGTLTASALTQRFSMQAKQREIEAQQRQRSEEHAEEHRRAAFTDRRACSIALNTAAQGFRRASKNCLFEGLDKMGDELEHARQAFADRYSEAQIILPDDVVRAAAPVYALLATAYGMVKTTAAQGPVDTTQTEG